MPETATYGHNVGRLMRDYPAWIIFSRTRTTGYRARRPAKPLGHDLRAETLDELAEQMSAADSE